MLTPTGLWQTTVRLSRDLLARIDRGRHGVGCAGERCSDMRRRLIPAAGNRHCRTRAEVIEEGLEQWLERGTAQPKKRRGK